MEILIICNQSQMLIYYIKCTKSFLLLYTGNKPIQAIYVSAKVMGIIHIVISKDVSVITAYHSKA